MKKEAYEVEYYEPKSVLAMQATGGKKNTGENRKKG